MELNDYIIDIKEEKYLLKITMVNVFMNNQRVFQVKVIGSSDKYALIGNKYLDSRTNIMGYYKLAPKLHPLRVLYADD